VDIKNVQIQQNTTPDYNPSLTKPKRVRYKDWMEVEVTFDVKKEKGLLEKNGFTGADVKAWGIEVYYNGAVAGWKSSTGPSRWWVDGAASLQPIEGLLLPKAKTPFAPLWGDYDLETAVR
jgi:hypothetical protein